MAYTYFWGMGVRKIIGLTGGIGSGKSTVARVLEVLGIPVFYADNVAKEVYYEPNVKSRVLDLLGHRAYGPDGRIDKNFIASQVFSNNDKLDSLNAIIHPAVRQQFKVWEEENEQHEILVREAAILFESGSHEDCDFTITVSADKAERVKRVMRRDGVTREAIEARMKKQFTDDQRSNLADYIIINDRQKAVIPQVEESLRFFSQKYVG